MRAGAAARAWALCDMLMKRVGSNLDYLSSFSALEPQGSNDLAKVEACEQTGHAQSINLCGF
jgi:hypothetical protein